MRRNTQLRPELADAKQKGYFNIGQVLEAKIGEAQSMTRALKDLADHCRGDRRPECPILDALPLPNGRSEREHSHDARKH